MTFKEILMRYHISPLQYQDGKELEERDYLDMFRMLLKYYNIRNVTEGFDIPKVDAMLMKRVVKNYETSLIPFEPEELMDILMQKKGEMVNETETN